jgi:hypothetical protein
MFNKKNHKIKRICYAVILFFCMFSFLFILPYLPSAHASQVTPLMMCNGTTTQTDCLGTGIGSTFRITGNSYLGTKCSGSSNSSQFCPYNPITTSMTTIAAGSSIIVIISCSPTTVTVSQIVDIYGNVFTQALTAGVSGINKPAENSMTAYWIGQVANAENYDSFKITFSGTASSCFFNFIYVTSYLQYSSTGSGNSYYQDVASVSSGTLLTQNIGSGSLPANSISFYTVYSNESGLGGGGLGEAAAANLPYQYLIGCASCGGELTNYAYSQSSTSLSAASSVVAYNTVSKISFYEMVVTFITGSQAITNTYQFNVGCTNPNLALTSTQLTGNTTYLYTLPLFSGSTATILSINLYIASYTSDGHHAQEPIAIGLYSTVGVGNISPTNYAVAPYSLVITVNTGFTYASNGGALVISNPSWTMSSTSANYLSISTKYTGLKIYQCASSSTMYQDTADGYFPSDLYSVITNSTNVAFGAQEQLVTFATVITSTVYSTIAVGTSVIYSYATTSTVTVGTVTSVVTQTTTATIYNLQGGQGSGAIETDLITFLPMWILPLLFGVGFGIIGLIIGLLLGMIIGISLGIVPLWAAFILGVIMVYLFIRRG